MQLTADRPLTARAGTHIVQLSIAGPSAYRVEVLAGGAVATPVDDLTRSYVDEQLARTVARVITLALRREGATVESAAAAVAQFLTAAPVLVAGPVGLQALARLGERRQVRPTMAGAHHAAISVPQRLALATAVQTGGSIRRGRSFPAPVLRALARKGLATLIYRDGSSRPDIVSATLTALGWREAVAA
ncbi:hypothetical protein [Phytohabitans houttuyneae]|uniref:Uncharacterized protein n=1 Tax=Phytohabitans houttuyneae TaxID=1076126 RepID=A0A6V8KCI4_9ACTN|nr:hypothetical protein [Phytohabitans houttuyneae]GFJ79427.1 hypothetical protein Phou_036070 [Phytohabitans houttuyneae]